ncbi:Fic family protein [Candidatus Palauibacter sp.]|uniref:Fic family protein n=1 Tax=Candidatus Palauibacter sp. TaxID=3101350 RepID=UPI003AF270F3
MAGDDDERLWRKLRLEWNYNSNHIEGNTLTYDETVLLLIHGQTAGSHPLRDYEEMKAHDVAIELVRRLAAAEQPLTEADIRELNRTLLKEPFWKSAETPDGRPTRKRIIPGEYKKQPNHVRTASGELHRFAEPEATPALMEDWVRRFRRNLTREDYPFPTLLAKLHSSFVDIHPFDDGNGRTARLLTNYVLLRKDLPPIVIESKDRDRYIAALRRADAGNNQPLEEFMLTQLLWSLDLGMRAARGESLREPDDIDKEISIFVRGQTKRTQTHTEILDATYELLIRPTAQELDRRVKNFTPLFRVSRTKSTLHTGGRGVGGLSNIFLERSKWEDWSREYVVVPGVVLGEPEVVLTLTYEWEGYLGDAAGVGSLRLEVRWYLDSSTARFAAEINQRSVSDASYSTPYSRMYDKPRDSVELVTNICRAVMSEIRANSETKSE